MSFEIEELKEELTELDKAWLEENLSADYFPMSLKSMEESKNRYEQAFYACNTLYANLHMDNDMVDILHKIKPYLSTIESYALKEWQSYLDDIIERKKELRAMRKEKPQEESNAFDDFHSKMIDCCNFIIEYIEFKGVPPHICDDNSLYEETKAARNVICYLMGLKSNSEFIKGLFDKTKKEKEKEENTCREAVRNCLADMEKLGKKDNPNAKKFSFSYKIKSLDEDPIWKFCEILEKIHEKKEKEMTVKKRKLTDDEAPFYITSILFLRAFPEIEQAYYKSEEEGKKLLEYHVRKVMDKYAQCDDSEIYESILSRTLDASLECLRRSKIVDKAIAKGGSNEKLKDIHDGRKELQEKQNIYEVFVKVLGDTLNFDKKGILWICYREVLDDLQKQLDANPDLSTDDPTRILHQSVILYLQSLIVEMEEDDD